MIEQKLKYWKTKLANINKALGNYAIDFDSELKRTYSMKAKMIKKFINDLNEINK